MSYSVSFPWTYGSVNEAKLKAILPQGYKVEVGLVKKFDILEAFSGKKVGEVDEIDGQIVIQFRDDSHEALNFVNVFGMLHRQLDPRKKVWAYVFTSPETGLKEINEVPYTSLREAKKQIGHYTGTHAYLVHFFLGDYDWLRKTVKVIHMQKVNRNASLGKEEGQGQTLSLSEV